MQVECVCCVIHTYNIDNGDNTSDSEIVQSNQNGCVDHINLTDNDDSRLLSTVARRLWEK